MLDIIGRNGRSLIVPSVSLNEFKILRKGFDNNRMKRKISEALLIKHYRPTVNTQENSISLELFN